ncbi:MAG TPA: DHA2 family efflux MFS transporter permease subunit [Candidatus Binatia bacterium]|jgi:DHA2 family multidrug resistance protein|nr:DHA2 family efflux MFS transporter permease subunit [Candidatus Binatia bacterium]
MSSTPARSPWLVAVAVVVPTFMEVLDTTVANVALRYIAGGLSAAVTDGEWVITSYLASNAFVLPISGWLSARVGRRNYFLGSIAMFTFASGLCGIAGSLPQLILFRVLQGMAGGGLQPSSQAILLDAFPRERQGAAMTMFGIAALTGPIVGPTLGGWLVDNYDWRWIFYINVPVGLLAFAASYRVLEDPPYLSEQRAQLARQPLRFDGIGLGLLALTMASWEIVLSKGQEWDWLGDPFWRVQTLLIILAVAAVCLVVRELTIDQPVVDLRVLRERNLAVSCVIIFSAFAVLYAATTTLPSLLQTLFGYDAYLSGLVMSPAGFFSIAMMAVVGALLGRGTDARWLIAAGLLVVSAGSWWMSTMNLDIEPFQVIWPRVVMIVGLSLIFAPLNVAAYLYTPLRQRAAAVGLFALLRNEGGSFGTSMAQTLQERREQLHTLRLSEHVETTSANAAAFLEQTKTFLLEHTADPVKAAQMAHGLLGNLRRQQALSLAYFDVFWVSAVVALGLVLVVLLMKRSVAEQGAHVGAE